MKPLQNGSNLKNNRPKDVPVWQLITIFGIVVLLLVSGGVWFYNQQAQNIRQDKFAQLQSIAKLKVNQIVQWRQERLGDARVNSENPFIRMAVEQWLKTPEDTRLRTNILGMMKLVMNGYNYQNVILAASDGRLLLSVDSQMINIDSNPEQLALQAITAREPLFGDFYQSLNTNQVHLDIADRVLDENNQPMAVLILQVDPGKYLYPLIQSWPTPSQSAETLLIRKDGADVLYLNTLRYRIDPPLTLRIPLTRTEVPAVQAILGRTGEFDGLDYRGVNTLSEIEPVPGTSWFMVAKVDTEEILSEVRSLGLVVLLFIVLSMLMTAALAGFIFNTRQRMLYQNLYQTERERGEAQEEIRTTLYSIGDGVITTDQAGKITRLNPIAENLTGWNENEAKGQLLEQVFHIINEWTRDEVENPVVRVLREGLVVGLANHTLLIARDKTERPIDDSGAPIRDEKGNIIGVVLVFRDQTEEHVAQKEQALLTYTINTSLNEIYLFDATSLEFRYVNSGGLTNLGYSLDQMQAMTPLDIKPEFTRETFQTLIQPLIDHKEPAVVFDTIHRRADGSLYPVEVHLQLFEYEGERVFLAVIQDVTVRKQTEEALLASEARYRKTLDAMLEGCQILGFDWKYLYLNDVADQHNRRPREELLGKKYMDVWPDIESTAVFAVIKQCLEERLPQTMENEFLFPNGNIGWFELRIYPVPEGIVMLSIDITERKKTQEALIESEEGYRQIFEQAADGIFIADNQGNYIDVNSSGCVMLGYTPEEILKLGIKDLLIPEDLTQTPIRFNELNAGTPIISERRMRRKDGALIDVEISGRRLADGRLQGMIRDISDRKRAEDEIHRLNDSLEIKVRERTIQLESANKELEAFAYSVSHDLRAPLRAMDGFSAALLKNYPDSLDEKGQHYLERIQEASRRMGQLINDLLSLSRVTRTEFNRQQVNLSALAKEIADNLAAQVPHRSVIFDISPDLIVQGDAHLLKIVFENLLNNAYKFTGQRKQAYIQVGVIEQDGRRVFFVRDNGVGFDMNYIDKLFAPFQRLHSMQEFPGTGIGLVTVQRIIHRHGGSIWPEAVVNQGATFYLTLGGE